MSSNISTPSISYIKEQLAHAEERLMWADSFSEKAYWCNLCDGLEAAITDASCSYQEAVSDPNHGSFYYGLLDD